MTNVLYFFRAIIIGSITGIVISIPLGPAGIQAVNQTISYGFRKGMSVSIGALLADLTYLLLINMGLLNLLSANKTTEAFFWIISGIILVCIGYFSLDKTRNCTNVNNGFTSKFNKKPFLQGFLITFSNPMTPTLWLTLSGTIIKKWYDLGKIYCYIFIFSLWIGMIAWFVLLNFLALKGFKLLKNKSSNITNYIFKILILIIGLFFIIFGIFKIMFK